MGSLALPEGVTADDILAQQADDDGRQMSMSMNQVGSNFFVMGDYIKPDKDFIELDDFVGCYEENMVVDGDNDRVKDMKVKAMYDCVEMAEKARRAAIVNDGEDDGAQPGPTN